MACIVFISYKRRHKKKKQQTKENQFQSFNSMSETGGHRTNIASSMFTILLGDSILTNQNSLIEIEIKFRRQNGLETKIARTFFGPLTSRA